MKINRRGYRILLSADEKTLFTVGTAVSVFDISGEKAVELKRFNNLKDLSDIAVSSDGWLIAYKNTSGHIAVHDLKTGKLLLKHRCTSREGNDLFFIRNNQQILSSDWDGKVFTLDIASGEFTIVCELPIRIPNMCRVSETKFIITGKNMGEYTSLFELSIGEDITWNKLCTIPPYCAESHGAVVLNGKLFFCADTMEGDISGEDFKSISTRILIFDTTTKELSVCVEIEKLLGLEAEMRYEEEHGYFTCMCISKDERTLLLGTYKKIIGIDLTERKVIGIREAMFLSSLRFMASDTKVVIGTWKNLQIVDFETMFQA